MLNCKEMCEKASAFHDEELNFYQRMRFKIHLLTCGNCQQFIKNFKLSIAMYQRKNEEEAKKNVTDEKISMIKDKLK